jgi:hypothetical protein
MTATPTGYVPCDKDKERIPHLRGFLATQRYMGVKMRCSPPLASPMAPCCSMVCTLEVPVGARRISSRILSMNVVSGMPTGVNWNRWVNTFHDGVSGWYLQGPQTQRAHKRVPQRQSRSAIAAKDYVWWFLSVWHCALRLQCWDYG